jgi:hypothetical protein
MPWVVFGVALLLIDLVISKPTTWTLAYGVVYGLSGLTIAVMLYLVEQKTITAMGMLVGALVSLLPDAAGMGYLDATTAVWIGLLGLVAVYVLNTKEIIGKYDEKASYLVLVPFAMWAVVGGQYLLFRIQNHMPLPWQTILYHVSFITFGISAAVRFASSTESKDMQNIEWFFALLVVFSAVLLTAGLGWGLVWS